jgi:hypothetical protein
MGRYIGSSQVIAYLGISGTSEDALISLCVDRAESAIDTYTRRNFAGTAGSAFYNRFEQWRVRDGALYTDTDIIRLDSLQNGDGQMIPTGSYWLEPRNHPPYRMVRLMSAYVYVWNTDSDVIMAGTFGYSLTPPNDIVQSAVRLAAYYYRQKDVGAMSDVAGFNDAGNNTIAKGFPDDVRYLLNPYRSRTGGAV